MVRMLCALVLVPFLAACGSGGSSSRGGPAVAPLPEQPRQPTQPTTPRRAAHVPSAQCAPLIPVYRLRERGGDWWRIGMGSWLLEDALDEDDRQVMRTHDETDIRHTRMAPEPLAAQLVRLFLQEPDAERFFTSPPTVRVADQGDRLVNYVLRTVRLLNGALPTTSRFG